MDLLAPLDPVVCYRAVRSRDRRFDGVFYTAVRTTGIYCRPSCPARTPAPENVTFHRTAAAAQRAGHRACRRCRPDATPGSPEWDAAADVSGRAMRLVADGLVDREGVTGLADRLGYTSRHLTRLLTREVGAGPLALARARRAQTARILVESTSMRLADVAFAAGFSSVRQFNDTFREVYAVAPSELRRSSAPGVPSGCVTMRLPVRTPYDGAALLRFLADRAVPGVETVTAGEYARTLRLPHGHGTVRLRLPDVPAEGETAHVRAEFALADLRDLTAAVERARRLLDADADPVAVDRVLGDDPVLGPWVRRFPGRRVPGHVDGDELAVRAVLGQQVSVRRARRLAEQLVGDFGATVTTDVPGLTRLFPTAAALADADPSALGMPRSRGSALVDLARRLADGTLVLDRGADRERVRAELLAVRGIGPWTAGYVAMRALGDPDVLLPGDVGTRHGLRRLGTDLDAVGRWRPWRSYAQLHLWQSLPHGPDGRSE